MAKSFGSLLEKMSPERRERVEDNAQRMLLDMVFQEIRQNRVATTHATIVRSASLRQNPRNPANP